MNQQWQTEVGELQMSLQTTVFESQQKNESDARSWRNRMEVCEKQHADAVASINKSNQEQIQQFQTQLTSMRTLVNRYESKLESLGIDLGMKNLNPFLCTFLTKLTFLVVPIDSLIETNNSDTK
jgi:chromosome segregation ATPase